MNRTGRNAFPWRALWLIPLSILGVLTIVATGGGGGGDDSSFDGDGDVGPVVILPTYNLLLTNLQGDNLLTAAIGTSLTVSIDIDGILHNAIGQRK